MSVLYKAVYTTSLHLHYEYRCSASANTSASMINVVLLIAELSVTAVRSLLDATYTSGGTSVLRQLN
jgi:hypothetical protein